MGTSSTQSTTNMKSKIQGTRRENIYISNPISTSFHLCASKNVSAQFISQGLHLFLEQYFV